MRLSKKFLIALTSNSAKSPVSENTYFGGAFYSFAIPTHKEGVSKVVYK